MGVLGCSETVELLARRIDVLERLAGEPSRKRDAVEDLDCSRSTLDRAVRQLSEAGLLERRPEGYVTTLTGRLAAERYRAFLDDERTILSAEPVLSVLPPDCDLPAEVLAGAEVATADGEPHELVDRLLADLRTADSYRAVLPRLEDTRHLRLCHARLGESLETQLLVPTDLLDRLRREFPGLSEGFADADHATVRTVDPPSYGFALAETGGETVLTVLVYDEGDLAATVRTDSSAAVAWARDRFGRLRENGRPAVDRLVPEDATGVDDAGLGATAALSDAGFVSLDRE